MTILAGIYGARRPQLIHALQYAKPFTTRGALRGNAVLNSERAVRNARTVSQLNAEWMRTLEHDNETSGIAYWVVSYSTPIAWRRNDGRVRIVGQRFGSSTTRHQSASRELGSALPDYRLLYGPAILPPVTIPEWERALLESNSEWSTTR